MHGDVGIPVGSGLDARAELRLAVGEHVQCGARRRDASASHEFDLRGALEQLLAHAQADLVGAVGDICADIPVTPRQGRLWVNRVDPAMSMTCPLWPPLLSDWCGAAKRRDVPTTDIASILMIAGASYIAWGVIDRTAGELTVS